MECAKFGLSAYISPGQVQALGTGHSQIGEKRRSTQQAACGPGAKLTKLFCLPFTLVGVPAMILQMHKRHIIERGGSILR